MALKPIKPSRMDQNMNCLLPNILGLADLSLLPPSRSPRSGHAKVIKVEEKGLKHAVISEEEIKREIETEIERDLEEEIKGGIYQHALRLRRLYQHRQKAAAVSNPPPVKSDKELLEVNISIRMEGETKMEIRETKKAARTARSDIAARTVPEAKRLDWVKSLRSSHPPPPVVGKNVGICRNKCCRSRFIINVAEHRPNFFKLFK